MNREDLKNKAEFETISRELQVELAKIEAEKTVRVEMAHAVGAMMASSKMTVWGSPDTVREMSEYFLNGQKTGFFVDGPLNSTPENAKDVAHAALSGVGKVGAAIVEALIGKKIAFEIYIILDDRLK